MPVIRTCPHCQQKNRIPRSTWRTRVAAVRARENFPHKLNRLPRTSRFLMKPCSIHLCLSWSISGQRGADLVVWLLPR